MKVALTDRFCDRAKVETQTDYFDEKVSGLALRVTRHGVKTWSFLYSAGGKRRRITLGRYPAISLAAARALALEATASGGDPKSARMTVADLAESYIANHTPGLRSGDNVIRRLRKDIVPTIGNVPLAELHRRDATRVVDAIKARGSPIEAARTFEHLRGMLRWAVGRGDLDHNPIEGMARPPGSKPRERFLTEDEILTVWTKLPDAIRTIAIQRIVRLCLLTAQRVGEVAGMTAAELDHKARVWNIPGSRTKNGHAHCVPLSNDALAIIGDDFDGFGIKAASTTIAHAIQAAQPKFGIAQWKAHDLRRTALSGMAKLGVEPIVLGHIANHRTTTKAGMTLSVYVHHAYEKEKREALELWADRLTAIVAGNPVADVAVLRGVR